MNKTWLSSLFAFPLVVGCGAPAPAQSPAASNGEPTATTNGVTSVAPAETPAPETHENATNASAPDDSKAKAFAAKFKPTNTPTLAQVPPDGIYGAIGNEAFTGSEVTVKVNLTSGEWELSSDRGGASESLGPTIILKGQPIAKKLYSAPMGTNRGLFQTPQKGKTVASAKEFKDTTSFNGQNAYAIQLDSVTIPKTGDGKASGKFIVVYGAADGWATPWAAGTFHDARVAVYR